MGVEFLQLVADIFFDVLEGVEVGRGDGGGSAAIVDAGTQILFVGVHQAAIGVIDDHDFLGAQQVVGDDQGAQRVLGNDASGVANDVGVSGFQAQGADREPGVHAGKYGQLALRAWGESAQFVGARINFVCSENLVDDAHGRQFNLGLFRLLNEEGRDRSKMGSMETELSLGQQKIRFDREATVTLYRDTITVPGADRCRCISCKNFAAQRRKIYPEEFLKFLNELGVDPGKEWEAFAYDSDPENPGGRVYGGWFLFSGELLEGTAKRPEGASGPFAHWFTTSFPKGALSKEAKFCAVEFLAQIPWVLPELSGGEGF